MTEKQYSLIYHGDDSGAFIKDNENGIEWYHDSCASLLEIVDKLNGLSEENKDLEEARSYYQENFLTMKMERNQLKKENEGLKSRVDDLEYQLNYATKCKGMCFKDIEILDKKYEKLYDENKELKRQVKEAIFHIDVLIDVSAPATERISLLLDLKENLIEIFGEWVIEYD